MINKKLKLLIVVGTRPEAIKLAPLIKEFQKYPSEFEVIVCVSGQHREMLKPVLDFFNINPDYHLDLMTHDQTLFSFSSRALLALENVLNQCLPDIVFVQGDTTTAFIASLAAFYKKIRVAHVEAGLRTNNIYSPFPEELNRKLVAQLATYHFTPTEDSCNNLLREGISTNIVYVRNTVVDAIHLGLDIIKQEGDLKYFSYFGRVDFNKKIILATCHRRENLGDPLSGLCQSLLDLVNTNADVEVVFPVHLNPAVQDVTTTLLSGVERVHLYPPLPYPFLIWLMSRSYLILTDSGGIQEEAPSLGVPVLVLRDYTERIETIRTGNAKLVGTNHKKIFSETQELLVDNKKYTEMAKVSNEYGDGLASGRIVEYIRKYGKS